MSEPTRDPVPHEAVTTETATQEQQIEIRGRWIGDMSDPGRYFEGVIERCDHRALPGGCQVTVLFDPGPPRMGSDAGRAVQHGGYRLSAGNGDGGFMLTTFARADAPYGSSERQSGAEEIWKGRVVDSVG